MASYAEARSRIGKISKQIRDWAVITQTFKVCLPSDPSVLVSFRVMFKLLNYASFGGTDYSRISLKGLFPSGTSLFLYIWLHPFPFTPPHRNRLLSSFHLYPCLSPSLSSPPHPLILELLKPHFISPQFSHFWYLSSDELSFIVSARE